MVENTIYRYKTIIGRHMTSRTMAGQRIEVQLACKALNTMSRLVPSRGSSNHLSPNHLADCAVGLA
jgi:hypothetical protein